MTILQIDRSTPFVPSALSFMSKDWKIIEQDRRSLRLTEMNLDEIVIHPEEARADRFNDIYLDAGILMATLKNPHLVPDAWKKKVNDQEVIIFFKGTVIQSPYAKKEFDSLYVLGMWWSSSMKEISCRYYYLDEGPAGGDYGRWLVEEIRAANIASATSA